MELLIIIILLVISLIIFGLIRRKRIYDTIDRLENWKLELMNRNIAQELGQIKQLNLSGDTQEKFEAWKTQWEQIVTKELPDVEEYLFDAETAADRYRFPTAKKHLRKIEDTLKSAERDIESILTDLNNLLETEKMGREEVEQIEPELRTMRQTILNNRYQFSKADVRFEVLIDEAEDKLTVYYNLIEDGNYFDAKKQVETLKQDVEEIKHTINVFPDLLKKCKRELPEQLDNLHTGLKKMKADGYRVDHLGFENDIQHMHNQLAEGLQTLEKGQTGDIQSLLDSIEARIQEMYELLEKEAVARNYVESNLPVYQDMLNELDNDFTDTKTEVETLKESYHFDEKDMQLYLNLEQSINHLKQQMETLAAESEANSHADMREKIEEGMNRIDTLKQEHEEFKELIRALRKDELEAKASIQRMKERIHTLHRQLIKSNIPGIPPFVWNIMEEAMDKNNQVLHALDEHPLDMKQIQKTLDEAWEKVEQTAEQTDFILEQAYLTERVIQYANRYRSQNPELAADLEESERLFRSFDYELALEKAAAALETVEPGALGRIEANVEELETVSK